MRSRLQACVFSGCNAIRFEGCTVMHSRPHPPSGLELQAALGRRLSVGEMYYSLQPPGAALGRHMDERHEATKGRRSWDASDRRSVSWLLYLSGDG